MFGYCPGCGDVLADIGPGEEICLDSLLAEVRAEPQEERTPKKCIRGDGMMDETAAAHQRCMLRCIAF